MKKKKLWRAMGTGILALSLMASPMAGISVLAAEGDDTPTAGAIKDIDPTREAKAAVGTPGEEGYKPAVEAYSDTEIPVWGFTQNTTIYSVDVEWGAMTFQYENSSWDPETHKSKEGAGWRVYDSESEKALEAEEDAINEIKVTNHSNAGVWATLTYASKTDYSDTTGAFSFTTGTETGDANTLTAAAGDVPAYLTLATADNNGGEGDGVGKAVVGKAYFMPTGISAAKKTDGIEKWTTIGTITVGIKTEEPKAPVGP